MPKLPYRLRRLMQHKCDLYRLATLAMAPGSTFEASDLKYESAIAYSGVLCYYEATPEFDEPAGQGLTKQVNIMTSDKWHFLAEQEIGDTWVIVMRTPGHPDIGKAWVTQGNTTMNASMPGRPTDSQWIYAKLSPKQLIPA